MNFLKFKKIKKNKKVINTDFLNKIILFKKSSISIL